MFNSSNPSYWGKNWVENAARAPCWRGSRGFSPEAVGSFRLSADSRHTTPSGMACVPPAVETLDAHPVVGVAAQQQLSGELGSADEPGPAPAAGRLQPAEDRFDALAAAHGDPVGGMAGGAPVQRRARLLGGHVRDHLALGGSCSSLGRKRLCEAHAAMSVPSTLQCSSRRSAPATRPAALGVRRREVRVPQRQHRIDQHPPLTHG